MLAEAALVAVAKAILDKASADGAWTAARALRSRVQGDPAQRAVVAALRSALARCAETHPVVRDAMFDEPFLTGRGAPLLARYLVPGERPRPEELAEEWSRQFFAGRTSYPGDELTAASRDFLVWFEQALRANDVVRPVFDSRAADESAKAISWIADRLASQLSRALIDPQPLYRELELDRFVGREWLLLEVASFLGSRRNGCFVLEGGPGLGKSTFLAWLARERGYDHHFVRLAAGRDDTAAALSNLAAQLAAKWNLDAPTGLFGPDVRPHEFHTLLEQAARARDERQPGRRIVLVVDGLNEASVPPPGENVLGLPRTLPSGVYLVCSQQPVDVPLHVVPREVCTLSAEDDRHRGDLGAYLEGAVERPALAAALRSGGVSPRRFIDTLVQQSGGVWLYVHYVVGEIELEQRAVDNLDELPFGLWQYYAQYLRGRREGHGERWEQISVPLLATLAAAQEPLTLATLSALAGLDNQDAAPAMIDQWQAFLTRSESRDPEYGLSHDSLRAFLSGTAVGGLSRGERAIGQHLARATRRADERIARRYLEAWGGLAAGLPGLRQKAQRNLDSGYGLRHLVQHLEAAEHDHELHRLLQLDWPSERRRVNVWYTARAEALDQTGYLSDLTRGWRRADQIAGNSEAPDNEHPFLLQCRYALLTASIHSLAAAAPPELMRALVEADPSRWSPLWALNQASQIAIPWGRAKALEQLHPCLPPSLLGDALQVARGIEEAGARAMALTELVGGLVETDQAAVFAEVLDAVRATRPDYWRADLLRGLADNLPHELIPRAIDVARSIDVEGPRSEALAHLASRLPKADRSPMFAEALAAARAMRDHDFYVVGSVERTLGQIAGCMSEAERRPVVEEALGAARRLDASSQAEVLAVLAPLLPKPQRAAVMEEALDTAQAVDKDLTRPYALSSVLQRLAADLPDELLPSAVKAAHDIDDEGSRAAALAALAGRLSGADQRVVIQTALEAAHISGDYSRARTIAALPSDLAEGLVEQVLDAARGIETDRARASALVSLASQSHTTKRMSVLSEALEAARIVGDEIERTDALIALASRDPRHGPTLLAEAVAAARTIRDTGSNPVLARALVAFASHAPDAERARAFNDALDAVDDVEEDSVSADLLEALARSMPTELLGRGFQIVGSRGHLRPFTKALAALAARGPDIDTCRAIKTASLRAWALTRLAERLPEEERPVTLAEALEAARRIDDDMSRVQAMVAVARRQPAAQRMSTLTEALNAARSGEALFRPHWLVTIAREMPEGEERANLVDQAFVAAQEVYDTRTMIAIIADDNIARALDAALTIDSDVYRGAALEVLARSLPTELVPLAWETACAIDYNSARYDALEVLAPHLPSERIPAAWDMGCAIEHEAARARILAALVPKLPPESIGRGLQAAREIDSPRGRARVLAALATRLPDELIADAVSVACLSPDEAELARALKELAPRIASLPTTRQSSVVNA